MADPEARSEYSDKVQISLSDTPVEPGRFLEKRSYRRRRLMDGLRLLPILGVWLFMVPVFWSSGGGESGGAAPGQGVSMSNALIYVFVVWCALIIVCAGLVRLFRKIPAQSDLHTGADRGRL